MKHMGPGLSHLNQLFASFKV